MFVFGFYPKNGYIFLSCPLSIIGFEGVVVGFPPRD